MDMLRTLGSPPDEFLAEACAAVSVDKQAALYHEIQQIVSENLSYIFYFYASEICAISRRLLGLLAGGVRNGFTYVNELWLDEK